MNLWRLDKETDYIKQGKNKTKETKTSEHKRSVSFVPPSSHVRPNQTSFSTAPLAKTSSRLTLNIWRGIRVVFNSTHSHVLKTNWTFAWLTSAKNSQTTVNRSVKRINWMSMPWTTVLPTEWSDGSTGIQPDLKLGRYSSSVIASPHTANCYCSVDWWPPMGSGSNKQRTFLGPPALLLIVPDPGGGRGGLQIEGRGGGWGYKYK